jgi:hypothetical protein
VKSLHEIDAHWTLLDLLDANITLDIWDDMVKEANKKAERELAANRK